MYLCSSISELFLSINETAARLRLAATEKAEAEKILQIKRAVMQNPSTWPVWVSQDSGRL